MLRPLVSRYELVGLDISEFIPEFDPLKLTALAAARLVKDFTRLTR